MNIQPTSIEELSNFTQSILCHHGLDDKQSKVVSDILIWCDAIGKTNQGIWRLPVICKRLEKNLFTSPCQPEFTQLSDSIIVADGNNGLGHYVAQAAMNEAITLASNTGVGIVTVNNSNFYGAGCYYTNQAADKDMISIALSNSFPKVSAHNGLHPVFGTNPFSFGAPQQNDKHLMLDMSTASSAGSTIRRQQENANPVNNSELLSTGTLLPASGAKGFGLAIMIEILAGILSKAGISNEVNSLYNDFERPGNNGHFFLVIDIKRFIDLEYYHSRFQQLVDIIKSSGNTDSASDIHYPG